MKIHYQIQQGDLYRLVRCGLRFPVQRRNVTTTARASVTCQRCRNFMRSDQERAKSRRGRR